MMSASWSFLALRMLVAGFALTLVGDVLFAMSSYKDVGPSRLIDTLLLLGVVFLGVQALHPSMTALTDAAGGPSSDQFRLVLLAGSALVPSVVLAIQFVQDEPLYVVANVFAMLVIVMLVAVRTRFITDRLRRAADLEAALFHFSSALVAAGSRDEIVDAARQALDAVANDHVGTIDLVLADDSPPECVAPDFAAPVMVRDEEVGRIVACAASDQIRHWTTPLTTIATELAIALERDQLVAIEHATAASLAEQNTRLRELDAMKDRFVSSVSHELRTPLTSMVGYLELLREGEAGELNSEQLRMLEIVDRNSRRLNKLIGDLLVMARLDSGRMEHAFTDVDLVGLVTRQVESIAALASKQGVGIDLVIDAPHVIVKGDVVRLGQMIDNLLSNGVKFTPPGGTVMLSVETSDDRVILTVTDTGVGIPADEVDHVFDRFYRASTVGTIGGTGLGLPIAKAIVEAHDGTIDAVSQVGVGTTFTISLPLPIDPDDAVTQPVQEMTT
jgi:signal transduction histidine kinase